MHSDIPKQVHGIQDTNLNKPGLPFATPPSGSQGTITLESTISKQSSNPSTYNKTSSFVEVNLINSDGVPSALNNRNTRQLSQVTPIAQ